MSVYIFAEHGNSASEMVSAAESLGQESTLIVIGEVASEFLAAGASRVVVLRGGDHRAENYAGAIADLVYSDDCCLFLIESTVRGRELAATVAAKLDRTMFSDAAEISIDGNTLSLTRTVYGGAVVATNTAPLPCIATVAAGAYEAKVREDTVQVDSIDAVPDKRVRFIAEEPIPAEGVDLAEAKHIVGVGLGFDAQEDLKLADELARALGGEVGCTRDVAENRKWLPKSRYIGITGVNASPDLYLAVGVSGQMQHVYGVRGAKVIAAINSSKDAPIFRSADYGIVGDLYDILPQLTEALSRS